MMRVKLQEFAVIAEAVRAQRIVLWTLNDLAKSFQVNRREGILQQGSLISLIALHAGPPEPKGFLYLMKI